MEMDDGAPGLGVGFEIDTGDSFGSITKLDDVIGETAANAVRQFAAIEQASKGAVSLGSATAGVTTFGAAATREMETARQAANKLEKQSDGLIRSLERQGAAFGKPREELRAMKVETMALALEQAGLTDQAARLRAAEQALYDQEFAAMRRAQAEAAALAEAKAQAALVAQQEAEAVRAAAQAHAIFEAKVRQGVAAMKEKEALERAAARDQAAEKMRAEAAAASNLAAEHARLAAQVRASHAAQEADALAAERMRASTDPLYAALKRVNAEIAESTRLYRAGATAPAEYARQQEVLAARLRTVGQVNDAVARGHVKVGHSLTQLSFQGNDIITMYMAGASAGQIFATQAGQIFQVVQTAEGGFWGLSRAVLAALAPFAPFIVVAGLAAGGLMLLHKQMNEDSGLKEYAAGLGLTHKEMKKLGDVSVTAGDMIKGLWKTIGDTTALGGFFSDVWNFIKGFTANFWDTILGLTGGLYTVAMGTYRGFVATWDQLPAAFADIFIRSVNAATEKLNGLGEATNKLLGVDLFGQIAPLENAYAGAAEKVSAAWSKAFSDSRKEWNDGLKKFSDDWTKNSQQAARDRLDAKAKDIIADRTPKTNSRADQLAREAAATEAQIRNLYALAKAYGVSDAAALIAEARVKAESQAIKRQADVEAAVDRQVRLAIAQRVSDGERDAAATRARALAQEQVNAMVAAGLVPAERAADLVRDRMADLPLLAAIEAAQQQKLADEVVKTTKALEDQRAARDRATDAARTAQYLAAQAGAADEIERLQLEQRMIDATTEARVRALATLKAWQEAQRAGWNVDEALAYVAAQVRVADEANKAAVAQERFNDRFSLSIQLAQSLGDSLSDAFGRGGNALGNMLVTLTSYQKAQEEIDRSSLSAADKRRKSDNLQITSMIGLTSAAKGLFSEHSKGYKAMLAAEQALTLVQLARTAVDVAGGAARMFATLGPFAFPAVAAMLGVMASLGFNGGGSVKAPTTNQGTGTVFGDTSAKSDSIKRSLDLLADLDTEMLVVSRQMAASLKAIESNIGGLTNLVIRLGGVDGIGSNAAAGVDTGFKRDLLGTALEEGITRGVGGFMGMATGMLIAGPLGGAVGLALGALTDFTKKIPILGDILGGIGSIIGGLFGTKTKVVGSGIFGGPQTLGDIDALGFTGQTFADIKKTKKFLGVSTGSKYSTKYGDLDASLEDQFGKLLLSFADAIKLAAGPLGLATGAVEAKLNAFVVDIGKIDLKGLSGEEIQEKLTAVFGQQADLMAQAVIDLQRFQKVGEGAFETLVRVASTVDVVTTSLQQLGLSSQSLGIDASMAIADLFGGAQDYATAAAAYFDAFYTDAEQTAARTAQLGRVFDSLGVAMPDSIAAYRALVEAQDLTTAAGQQLYAQLLQLAPAFAEIVSAGKSAASAAAILRERQDLEKQLLELQGRTTELRQRELEQLDPSNRALQMQIWAIQDQQKAAQDAASAAKELADAWGSVGDSIMAEVKRIRGLDATAAASSYQTLAAQFSAASAAARRGDMDAAKSLPELSRSLLDAAAGQVGSRRELDLIRGQTAASLEQTYRATEKMVSQQQAAADLASRALQVAVDQQGWWQSFADQQAAAADTSKAANDALVEELQGLRAQVATLADDQREIGATLAGNTGKVAKFTDNVTRGGDSIIVEVEGTVKTEAA
ncbi:hypothetical protein [Rhizorhabdus histidinilytica]|uniref:hypothetical protein n=1 Tax=Rhizorhabdus histidinilytica TaxID=439228 RepID=UPI00321FB68C